jgi:hypothetical protein
MASTPTGSDAAAPSALPALTAGIRVVDPHHERDTAAAARLHAVLFGEIGPIARLGERMLQRYCYQHLVRTGMLKAVLFEVDGEPAGLAAYTGDPMELHRAVLRSHLPLLTREVLQALVLDPALLIRLPAAARLMWDRRREKLPPSSERFAEMLAFGVLEPYRSRAFVRRTGLWVPDLLLDYVLDDVRTQGFAWGRGVVLESNTPAVTFFTSRAARVERYPTAEQPSIQVWFDLASRPPRPSI